MLNDLFITYYTNGNIELTIGKEIAPVRCCLPKMSPKYSREEVLGLSVCDFAWTGKKLLWPAVTVFEILTADYDVYLAAWDVRTNDTDEYIVQNDERSLVCFPTSFHTLTDNVVKSTVTTAAGALLVIRNLFYWHKPLTVLYKAGLDSSGSLTVLPPYYNHSFLFAGSDGGDCIRIHLNGQGNRAKVDLSQ